MEIVAAFAEIEFSSAPRARAMVVFFICERGNYLPIRLKSGLYAGYFRNCIFFYRTTPNRKRRKFEKIEIYALIIT